MHPVRIRAGAWTTSFWIPKPVGGGGAGPKKGVGVFLRRCLLPLIITNRLGAELDESYLPAGQLFFPPKRNSSPQIQSRSPILVLLNSQAEGDTNNSAQTILTLCPAFLQLKVSSLCISLYQACKFSSDTQNCKENISYLFSIIDVRKFNLI